MFPDIFLVCPPAILDLLQINITKVKVNKLKSVKLEPYYPLDTLETIKLELEPDVRDPPYTGDMYDHPDHILSNVEQPSKNHIYPVKPYAGSLKRKHVGCSPKKTRGGRLKAAKPLSEKQINNVLKTNGHPLKTGENSMKTSDGYSKTVDNFSVSVLNPQTPLVENLLNHVILPQNGLGLLRGPRVLNLATNWDRTIGWRVMIVYQVDTLYSLY